MSRQNEGLKEALAKSEAHVADKDAEIERLRDKLNVAKRWFDAIASRPIGEGNLLTAVNAQKTYALSAISVIDPREDG